MKEGRISFSSIRTMIVMMLPEMIGLAGIIVYYQYGFKWMAVAALLCFMALFLFVSLVGRCMIFIVMSLVTFSIPVAIFLIRPWYMGFLIPFVIVYGLIIITTFFSHDYNKKVAVPCNGEAKKFERHINN